MEYSFSPKVLVIEDNPLFQRILKKHLEAAGWTVVPAEDGLAGLSLARRIRPDMILLDLLLPGLDGHKICRLLKFDKELRHIPVMIFTSRDTEADAELAKRSHADAYVVKTVRFSYLMTLLENLLEKSRRFQTERIVFRGQELTYTKIKEPFTRNTVL